MLPASCPLSYAFSCLFAASCASYNFSFLSPQGLSFAPQGPSAPFWSGTSTAQGPARWVPLAVQPGAGWGGGLGIRATHRGCCTGGHLRQGSFLVTLTATPLPPRLSPFTAIGSFASGCGKCGQDGRSWRPLCVPVTAAMGMEWVQKKGLRSALVTTCVLLPEPKPCCVWLRVPSLTAIVSLFHGTFWVLG